MSKTVGIIVGVVVTLLVIYLVYESQRTTKKEAGQEISEAVNSTGEYLKDTGNEIKRDLET